MSRQERVAETIKQEVSNIIHDEVKDPRIGFVTITRVEVTADLREAKIFFSVLGKDEERKKTKDALDTALGFIRYLLARRVQLRYAPEISFREDRSGEYSVRIQELLEEIKQLDQTGTSSLEKAGKKERKKKSEPKKGRRLHKKK